ncbi:hypothetical protein [Micromonospora sp. DT47]|uniref:hypothetical protein n=1 Tax=Micromonospora sp. DT47 TaxID=3393431 RepID=UPI003CEA855E
MSGVSQASPGSAFGNWMAIGTNQPTFVGDPSAIVSATGTIAVHDKATDNWIWGTSQGSVGCG